MSIRPIMMALVVVVAATVAVHSVRSQQTGLPTMTGEPRLEQADGFLIVIAPQNDMFWAFSKWTGLWYPLQPVATVRGPIRVAMGESVAILQADAHLYGFSAFQGAWDTLALDRAPTGQPLVMKDWGAATTAERIHAFSAQTGAWATLDMQQERPRLRQ